MIYPTFRRRGKNKNTPRWGRGSRKVGLYAVSIVVIDLYEPSETRTCVYTMRWWMAVLPFMACNVLAKLVRRNTFFECEEIYRGMIGMSFNQSSVSSYSKREIVLYIVTPFWPIWNIKITDCQVIFRIYKSRNVEIADWHFCTIFMWIRY